MIEHGADEEDAVCFFVCDQPYLSRNTIEQFLKGYQVSGKGIGCVGAGERLGNPVVFQMSYVKELLSLTEDTGGKAVVKKHLDDLYVYQVEKEAGERLGNPVVFQMSYVKELLSLTEDTGGKAVVKKHLDDLYVYQVEKEELEDIDYRKKSLVIVRGAGDLASGVIYRMYREGYRVLALETEKPACIRRQVSYGEAVYDGKTEVEGVTAVRISEWKEMETCWSEGVIPILIDESGNSIERMKPEIVIDAILAKKNLGTTKNMAPLTIMKPEIVIDAILAKKNLGTTKNMAPLTIGLGPGFTAGEDVDIVIETMRGDTLGKIYHQGRALPNTGVPGMIAGYALGKIYHQGRALPNTGVPGMIAGYAKERVLHAPANGKMHAVHEIGDIVKKGELLAYVGETPVYATIDGILRGMIRENYEVTKGLKIMDIDPRISELNQCFLISDKAKKIANSVYETVKHWEKGQEDVL